MLVSRAPLNGLAVMLLVFLEVAVPARAADANPCANPQIASRLQWAQQQSTAPVPVLYDGVQPLRSAPKLPAAIAENVGPACVLLTSTLVRRGNEFFVEDAAYITAVGFIQGGGRTRGIQLITKTATQVLREIINQDVLPVAPSKDGRYFVAIPLWRDHPFFQRNAAAERPGADSSAPPAGTASGSVSALRDRGWPEAQLLSGAEGVDIYLLAQREHHVYFAVVRSLSADQPLLDVQETIRGQRKVLDYGPETQRRFRERILPYIRPNANRIMEVEVWHYIKDVHLVRQKDTWADKRHPLTGSDSVEVPAAVETWDSLRRASTEPFQWWGESEHFGVRRPNLNTMAEIRAAQEKGAAQAAAQEQYRTARDAKEQAEREARATRLAALEQERASVYPSKNLAYRAPVFWQRYKLAAELRAVFDGDFPEARRQWEFAQIYRTVVRSFSRRCDQLIPQGSPELRVTQKSYNPTYETVDTVYDEVIRIRQEWADPYEWWDKNLPHALPLYPAAAGKNSLDPLPRPPGRDENNPLSATMHMLGGVSLLARVQLALRDDMPLLFEDGCMNPVLTQLQENMRRMALGLPTLQAERASQLVSGWRDQPLTVKDACERNVREDGSDVGRNWCTCLEQVVNTRTTVGQRWEYLAEYKRFMRSLYMQPTGGQNDPAWQLYEAAGACVR